MKKLDGFKTNNEVLFPIYDIYLNKPCKIFCYNSNTKVNKDLENWLQTKMTCTQCGFIFVERLFGDGHNQRVVEVDHQKLIKEEYKCMCPYCENVWTLNATRPFDSKTLALSIDEDLNAGIQEVDDEIKESKANNK